LNGIGKEPRNYKTNQGNLKQVNQKAVQKGTITILLDSDNTCSHNTLFLDLGGAILALKLGAGKVLYHLSHAPSPFTLDCFSHSLARLPQQASRP
jgi:hypothetical protein